MYHMHHAGSHYGPVALWPPSSAHPQLTTLSCQTNEHARKAEKEKRAGGKKGGGVGHERDGMRGRSGDMRKDINN